MADIRERKAKKRNKDPRMEHINVCLSDQTVESALSLADRTDMFLAQAWVMAFRCIRGSLCAYKDDPHTQTAMMHQKRRKKRRRGYWNSPFVGFFWMFWTSSLVLGTIAILNLYPANGRSVVLAVGAHLYALFMISGNYLWMMTLAPRNFVKSGDIAALSADDRAHMVMSQCALCKSQRPERTHHCKYCKRCVLKRGHHCFFTRTCVGLHNQRHFTSLVTYQFLGIWRQNYFLWFGAPSLRMSPIPLLWYLFLLTSFACGVFIASLFARAWGAILLGSTETEIARTSLAEAFRSPLNNGPWHEFKAVFGRLGVLHMVLPLKGNVGANVNGMVWPRRSTSDTNSPCVESCLDVVDSLVPAGGKEAKNKKKLDNNDDDKDGTHQPSGRNGRTAISSSVP
uniref:Palmitoyltransferase n=1 Tax=Lotharella oceanica TaxID=641309 RepID=A0A7S2TU94_9EUKA